jgi:hypothetical protein
MSGSLRIANGLDVIDLCHSYDSIPVYTADTKENCVKPQSDEFGLLADIRTRDLGNTKYSADMRLQLAVCAYLASN